MKLVTSSLGLNTRSYPRTLVQAFGPYANAHGYLAPMPDRGFHATTTMVVYVASAITAVMVILMAFV